MTGRNSIAATVPNGRRSMAIEAGVHQRQDDAHRHHGPKAGSVQRVQHLPRLPPEREDDGSGDDSHPGDAERLDQREEEHGERRPEVVEDRTAYEERLAACAAAREGAVEDSRLVHPEIVAGAADICHGRSRFGSPAFEAKDIRGRRQRKPPSTRSTGGSYRSSRPMPGDDGRARAAYQSLRLPWPSGFSASSGRA